jgi:hypothetical protein
VWIKYTSYAQPLINHTHIVRVDSFYLVHPGAKPHHQREDGDAKGQHGCCGQP